MSFFKSIRERIFGKKEEYTVFDVNLDLRVFNNEMKKQSRLNGSRAQQLWEQSKKYYVNNQMKQVNEIMAQRMNALDKAFSIEMFTIRMDGLIFDLQSNNSVSQSVETLAKAQKALEKLTIFDVNAKEMMDKTFRTLTNLSKEANKIMTRMENYDPFSTIEHTSEDIQEQINLLEAEIKIGIKPPEAPTDYERRRAALDEREKP